MPDLLLFAIEVTINGACSTPSSRSARANLQGVGIFSFSQGGDGALRRADPRRHHGGQVPFAHAVNDRFGTEIHQSGWTVPALAAIVLTVGVMIVFAFAVQHFVFRHLDQELIIFFMATIGLAYSSKDSAT